MGDFGSTMTRRQALASLAALGQHAAAQPSAPPPDIVFVLSDDHSAPYLGCYGDKEIRTPNLDVSPRRACGSPTPTRRRRSAYLLVRRS